MVPILLVALAATVLYMWVGYLAIKRVKNTITAGEASSNKSAAKQRKVHTHLCFPKFTLPFKLDSNEIICCSYFHPFNQILYQITYSKNEISK